MNDIDCPMTGPVGLAELHAETLLAIDSIPLTLARFVDLDERAVAVLSPI